MAFELSPVHCTHIGLDAGWPYVMYDKARNCHASLRMTIMIIIINKSDNWKMRPSFYRETILSPIVLTRYIDTFSLLSNLIQVGLIREKNCHLKSSFELYSFPSLKFKLSTLLILIYLTSIDNKPKTTYIWRLFNQTGNVLILPHLLSPNRPSWLL